MLEDVRCALIRCQRPLEVMEMINSMSYGKNMSRCASCGASGQKGMGRRIMVKKLKGSEAFAGRVSLHVQEWMSTYVKCEIQSV